MGWLTCLVPGAFERVWRLGCTTAVLGWLGLGPGTAAAAAERVPLSPAEFRNTAHVLERGQVVLHPLFFPSSVGISDHIELKSQLLGSIWGLQLGLELSLLDMDFAAISFEPTVRTYWGQQAPTVGGMVRSSMPLGKHWLHLGYGAARVSDTSWRVPLELGIELVRRQTTAWRLVSEADAIRLVERPAALLGVNWNRTLGRHGRIALGLGFVLGDLGGASHYAFLAANPSVLEEAQPRSRVEPTFELWWTF